VLVVNIKYKMSDEIVVNFRVKLLVKKAIDAMFGACMVAYSVRHTDFF